MVENRRDHERESSSMLISVRLYNFFSSNLGSVFFSFALNTRNFPHWRFRLSRKDPKFANVANDLLLFSRRFDSGTREVVVNFELSRYFSTRA